jgi:predicted nucleic acid-binding protein
VIAFSRSKRLRSSFTRLRASAWCRERKRRPQLRDWTTEFATISADSGALWAALELAIDGRLAWWDALLLATAERHGCNIVLSENMQDGARFGGITILNPFVGQELPEPVAELLR